MRWHFFDGIHPTTAAHGIVAAFADAVLASDSTQFLDGTQSVIHAGHGDNFIFATPINPANPALNDDYTIFGGPGDDVIFAGSGNVTVHGGSGPTSSRPARATPRSMVVAAPMSSKPIPPVPTHSPAAREATRSLSIALARMPCSAGQAMTSLCSRKARASSNPMAVSISANR
jgi:RTX calcium-binding nonapeptide repeat (4 copies)